VTVKHITLEPAQLLQSELHYVGFEILFTKPRQVLTVLFFRMKVVDFSEVFMSSYTYHVNAVSDKLFFKRIDRSLFQCSVNQDHNFLLFNAVFCCIFK
jgi:hypothetical protein